MRKIHPATARFLFKLMTHASYRKHTVRWLASLQNDYLIKHKQPWLVFDAIDFLDTVALKQKKVFEYGSGGSTLYWRQRGASCVSIEHDAAWYRRIKPLIPEVDYRLVEPTYRQEEENPAQQWDYANPAHYASADPSSANVSYKAYVCQIDEFEDETFDVVLVDGRSRPACLQHSVNKVKPGGLLLLDNADRSYYTEQTNHYLAPFTCQVFVGVVAQFRTIACTNIYTKNL